MILWKYVLCCYRVKMNGVKKNKTVTGYSLAVDTRCWCLRSCENTLLSSLLLRPAGAAGLSENAPNHQHVDVPFCALGNQGTLEANLEQTKILIPTIPCWGWKGWRRQKNCRRENKPQDQARETPDSHGCECGDWIPQGSWKSPFLGAVWWPGPDRWSCLSSFLSLLFLSNAIFLLLLPFHSHVLLPFLSPCSFLRAITGNRGPWSCPCQKHLEEFSGERAQFPGVMASSKHLWS